MTARLVAVVALWLACFAGTFPIAWTIPRTGDKPESCGVVAGPIHGPVRTLLRVRDCGAYDTTYTIMSMPGDSMWADIKVPDGRVYWVEERLWNDVGEACGFQSRTFALPALPVFGPPPPDTISGGLAARFYIGQSRGGAVVYADTSNVDGTWGIGSPGPGMPVDDWSAEWIGHVTIPTAGLWTWYLKSEDGAQLFLDGTLGINHLVVQPLTEWTWTVNMAAREYAIQVIYRANVGNSECHLSLSGPGFTKQVVPRGMLR